MNDEGGKNRKEAIRLLDAAIKRDPNFTLAYCLSVDAHIILYRYVEHTAAHLEAAKEKADKALQLAPGLGEAHLAKARYYYHGLRDYISAQRELDLAAPTSSGDAEFLTLSSVTERRLGRWRDALRDGERSVALNPRDAIYVRTLMESYRAVRDYAKLDEVGDKVIARLPKESTGSIWALKVDGALGAGRLDKAKNLIETAPVEVSWKSGMLAVVALYQRQYPEALRLFEAAREDVSSQLANAVMEGEAQRWLGDEEKSRLAFERARDLGLEKLRSRPNDPIISGELAKAYAGLHQKEEAVSLAKRFTESLPLWRDSIDGANCIGSLAEVYALLGDPAAAINELAKVVGVPNGPLYGDLRFNPVWDELRKDPRFEKVLNRATSPPDYE